MDIQRLRNLTTNILHTKMKDIYEDIEYFLQERGIMTHELPDAIQRLQPYLKKRIKDGRFWNYKFDLEHTGNIEVAPLNEAERKEFWR